MNYNTNLQAKNARIQALINKANTLPEAGAGSGSGSGSGVELPTLTNPASASDLRSGKQLIGQDGSVIEGAMANAKIGTNNTFSKEDGIFISSPVVTSAGYAESGTGSGNPYYLDTKPATTFTPGTADQTIAAYQYLTGAQIIKGDSNLVPENIVSGKTIFGVAGTAETGGGSGASVSIAHLYGGLSNLKLNIAFEAGMTWQQYIDSAYNVTATSATTSKAGLKASGNYVMSNVFAYYMVSTDGTASGRVKLSDAIVAGKIYQYYYDD